MKKRSWYPIGIVSCVIGCITCYLFPEKDPSHALKHEVVQSLPALDSKMLQAQSTETKENALLSLEQMR